MSVGALRDTAFRAILQLKEDRELKLRDQLFGSRGNRPPLEAARTFATGLTYAIMALENHGR